MNWYFDAWKRYAQFSGRASQEAFWVFFVVNLLITFAFVWMEIVWEMSWKVEAIYSLLIFLPLLSITVRRLHDTNRSAWWLLVVLVPAIGMVILLILLALPSQRQMPLLGYPQNNKIGLKGESNEDC